WRTDGTTEGTGLVHDINPGAAYGVFPYSLANVAGTLFFAADDGVHGEELWKSDGSADGTALVRDVKTLTDSSSPTWLTAFRGRLDFSASDGTAPQLWSSDGSEAGTAPVSRLEAGQDCSVTAPHELTPVGRYLFFAAGSNGDDEPWRSDGTPAGTGPI